ncbi:ISKra4 family transposase [Candidatus Uhrbacteria bacterium]|nr:ISKra4 family transposase [Candidatus Uhrbacteria bacterium]
MTLNSDTIIHEIRQEFTKLIDYVTNDAAHQATAYEIERGLFFWLLRLGAKLLSLFFVSRAENLSRAPLTLEDDTMLPYHSEKKRNYKSVFGRMPIWGPYFYKQGLTSRWPLAAELSLAEDCYSDFLRELSEFVGVQLPYNVTCDLEARFLNVALSTRPLQAMIATDSAAVEAYYAQKPPPLVATEAEILVVQADGKGVPIIRATPAETKVRLKKGQKRGRKKEAVVTTVYTIAEASRTPEMVIQSLFDQETPQLDPPPKPQHKQLWATLEDKDTALARLAHQVEAREGPHIQHRVALCDGCVALQKRIEKHFPEFELLLDFIHPHEYLWDTANALWGEDHPDRTAWVREKTCQMLHSQTAELIEEFRQLAEQDSGTERQRKQLLKTAGYFERNLPYMDYATYLARGWPIASGVIEGACRHFVKDRLELSGMRWTLEGAENLLRLRAVAENGDWDAYHDFRRRQRHTRLYTTPYPGHLPEQTMVAEGDADPAISALSTPWAMSPGISDCVAVAA